MHISCNGEVQHRVLSPPSCPIALSSRTRGATVESAYASDTALLMTMRSAHPSFGGTLRRSEVLRPSRRAPSPAEHLNPTPLALAASLSNGSSCDGIHDPYVAPGFIHGARLEEGIHSTLAKSGRRQQEQTDGGQLSQAAQVLTECVFLCLVRSCTPEAGVPRRGSPRTTRRCFWFSRMGAWSRRLRYLLPRSLSRRPAACFYHLAC